MLFIIFGFTQAICIKSYRACRVHSAFEDHSKKPG